MLQAFEYHFGPTRLNKGHKGHNSRDTTRLNKGQEV